MIDPDDPKTFIYAVDALNGDSQACFCIGPQNGEPLCPCRMKNVIIRNGRYIMPERDLGPVEAKGGKDQVV